MKIIKIFLILSPLIAKFNQLHILTRCLKLRKDLRACLDKVEVLLIIVRQLRIKKY